MMIEDTDKKHTHTHFLKLSHTTHTHSPPFLRSILFVTGQVKALTFDPL